jgi:hypothetical protein
MFLLLLSLLTPASFANDSLVNWSQQILNHVRGPEWSNASCVSYLRSLQKRLDQMNGAGLTREKLKVLAPELIENLWETRLALHDRLSESDNACAIEVRNTFRQFRFLEDFLGEIKQSPINLDASMIEFQKQPVPIDENFYSYMLQKNPNFKDFDLQPGDLIVARGVTFLSAMIARLGDIDSQFSHVILVTENPDTRKIETIEAYVGVGTAIYDRATALKNENARLLVLRPKDRNLARMASEQMRAYVMKHQGANKIPYDYELNFKDSSAMSCAEVSQYAMFTASNGTFVLPERPSTLTHGLDLLKNLGVTPGDSFTPGDLEYDSRFDMVAEWRDLRLTQDSRLRDAILTKVLFWMDHDGYKLHPSAKSKAAAGILFRARKTAWWPLIRKTLGIADFSAEIPAKMTGTVTLIGQLGDGMLAELQHRNQLFKEKTGLPMTYLELYQELERIRSQDESVYANRFTRHKSLILQYFRPF